MTNKSKLFVTIGILIVVLATVIAGIAVSDMMNAQAKALAEMSAQISSQNDQMASQSEQLSNVLSTSEATKIESSTPPVATTTIKATSEQTTTSTTKKTTPATTAAPTTAAPTTAATPTSTEAASPTTTAMPTTTVAVPPPSNSISFDNNKLIIVSPDLPLNLTYFHNTFGIAGITYKVSKYNDGTYMITPVYTGTAISMEGGSGYVSFDAKLYDSSNLIIGTTGAHSGKYSDGDNFRFEVYSFYHIPAGTYSVKLTEK